MDEQALNNTMAGPTRRWSVGRYSVLYFKNRLWGRWEFQDGGYGAAANNPFSAAYRVWKLHRDD